MKINKLLITSLIILATSAVHADTLYGLYTDLNRWNTDITSDVASELGNEDQLMFSVSVEHGVSVLPNIKAKYTDLTLPEQELAEELSAHTTDVIAYYEILDNIVSADLGVGTKNLKAEDFIDKTTPIVYASVGAKIPSTGLSTKAEISLAKRKNTEVKDTQAEIKYNFVDTTAMDFGAKIGYRVVEARFRKKEIEFKGPYLGMEVHF